MTWCPDKRAVNSRLGLTTQTGVDDTLAGPDDGVLSGNAELTSLALTAWLTPQPAVAAWPSVPSGRPRPSGISLVLGQLAERPVTVTMAVGASGWS